MVSFKELSDWSHWRKALVWKSIIQSMTWSVLVFPFLRQTQSCISIMYSTFIITVWLIILSWLIVIYCQFQLCVLGVCVCQSLSVLSFAYAVIYCNQRPKSLNASICIYITDTRPEQDLCIFLCISVSYIHIHYYVSVLCS